MKELWSYSTTVREANRIVDFLSTAKKINGEIWNSETQIKYQILLIKDRFYLNDTENSQTLNRLNSKQIEILKNKDHEMTYNEAKEIFEAKAYNDPAMRGRQSMSPLIKLGLMIYKNIGGNKSVIISPLGEQVLNGEIPIEDFFLDSLLKFQYPNPASDSNKDFNTKPFINAMRLIKEVNRLCIERNEKAKGLQKIEFGIFALSIDNYQKVNDIALKVLDFRKELNERRLPLEKNNYIKSYINSYLCEYKNPEQNVYEYTDNLIRYLRMSKYFIIRGKYENVCYDLEPSRSAEIDAILSADNGSIKTFNSLEDWQNYIGNYGTYYLPFESSEVLHQTYNILTNDIKFLSNKLSLIDVPTFDSFEGVKEKDKKTINVMREFKTSLQNKMIRDSYIEDSSKIDEAIDMLENIRINKKNKLTSKRSLELEKWSNISLNILDDSVEIKPNTKVGDDNEPINTAPAGKADIECFYQDFNAICEVTTLTNRDQWFNEGQPVMRHLRNFENNSTNDCYCLFIAPSLHADTMSTFFNSVKYGYDGVKQSIIPITINQLKDILFTVKTLKENGKKFTHTDLLSLYKNCSNVDNINSFSEWSNYLINIVNDWKSNLLKV